MGRLRSIGRLAESFVETGWNRLRGQRRSPHWPFRFEVFRGFLSRMADELVDSPTEEIRASHEAMAERREFDLPVERERTDIGGVPVEWFRPEAGPATGDAGIVYLHGGAYLFGSTNTHALLMGRLALDAGLPVVGVNYRLAPEHEVEEARDDAVAVWEALLERGWRADRLAMAGDSAGGGLAVSTALALRGRDGPLPGALGLISPWIDLTCTRGSYAENEVYDYGDARHIREMRDRVVGDRDPEDPHLSPILADLSGLPATLVHWGGGELLADDCRQFVDELEAAGVEVDGKCWPDMVHAFHAFYRILPAGREAIRELASYLSRRVRGGVRARRRMEG